MGKRIFLFLLTNLAVVLTLSVIVRLFGLDTYLSGSGLNLGSLAVFCLVWGMGGAFISLQMSRFIAKRSTGIRLVDGRSGNADADWLYGTVEGLTRKAGLPMPEVGIYESAEVNAFATGPSRSKSLVAVSSGLLRSMERREVEGVLAHEVAHIANGDMVTMTLLQGVVNAFVMFLARVIAFAIANSGRDEERRGGSGTSFIVVMVLQMVFGILGSMVTAWFSRQREFRADAGGASLAGREQMIGALRRLMTTHELVDTRQTALTTLKISGAPGWMMFFSTHPPLEQRIAALEAGR